MPFYESPAPLYIDFSRLPPPKVIEEIDYEKLLVIYQNQVVGKLPVLAKATKLQQSPTNVILQAEAYGEMMVRARINAAARAVMLPFATGADLDVLASFYNEPRAALVASPRPYETNPEDWESDERFRRKVQLAPEAFSTIGSQGAYIYNALKADVTLRDASATMMDRNGSVRVALMNTGEDPMPTAAQFANVRERFGRKNIKPLTAVITVAPPVIKRTKIEGLISLYPGPDQALVLADVKTALGKVRDRLSKLGRDLSRSSIFAALNQEGVQDVSLPLPIADIRAEENECVLIESAKLDIAEMRRE